MTNKFSYVHKTHPFILFFDKIEKHFLFFLLVYKKTILAFCLLFFFEMQYIALILRYIDRKKNKDKD